MFLTRLSNRRCAKMDARSLIAKLKKDIETYGGEKEIYYIFITNPNNGIIQFVWDYFSDLNTTKEQLYNRYFVKIYKTTLQDFYDNKVVDIRIVQNSGLQQNLDYRDLINQDLLKTYTDNYNDYLKQKENDYKKYSSKYWEIKEKHVYNPDDYIGILKQLSSKADDMTAIDCCKQDIDLFGENYIAHVYVEDDDDKVIYGDWLLDGQDIPPNNKHARELKSNEYFEDLTLIELYDIIQRQNNNEYIKPKKRGKILQFPK